MANVTPDLIQLYANSDGLGLAERIRNKEVSAPEIAETAITVIGEINPQINAMVIDTFDMARGLSQNLGDGPFAGVPYLLKNLITAWKGTPLTSGTPYLKNYVCPEDSEIGRKIRASGLIPFGRSNTPQCGWCITTENSMYGNTVSPWNPDITPGGSSGGAAASVAARMVPIADASDWGGSIRIPASCCGVVGLKPSRGRISYGPQDADILFGCAYLLANTRTVRDTAAYLDAIAGNLPGDPYHAPRPDKSWLAGLSDAPRKLRIGYTLKQGWNEPFAPEVRQAVEDALRLFESMGHTLEEYDIKTNLQAAWWAYNDIIAVGTVLDFKHYHENVMGRYVREDELEPFNWTMLQYGKTLSAADYMVSIDRVRRAGQAICTELAPYDVFVTPTLTQLPRPPGYFSMQDGHRERYLDRWSDSAFMFSHNLSGLPGMSLPLGLANGNIPIGIQIVGRHGDEATLLRLAAQAEEAAPWIDRKPAICAG